MNCPKCGTDLTPGSLFCNACGAGVTDPGAATVMLITAEQQDQLLVQLRRDLAQDYEVEKELGRGGMAVVYRAHEIELRRTVALKVLPPGMGSSDMAERFRREARMAAALDHPNIIPIYRVGQAAGTYYFAMKFVEGRAVDAIVEQQGALPVPVVLQILRATADALAFAHERQTVHRDIKGANILVDRDGRVLVSDFGIARAAEEKTLTASGSVIGTPHFMSPEQCAGQKVGPQSDQYSLGVLGFQMLTGQVPFDAESVITIIQHHYFTPVPDILSVREGVPEQLLAVVYRALGKDASQRYPSTREMVKALEAVPCSAEDRTQSEELLRELARGEAIPRVRTGSLPPLADARTIGAAMLAGGLPTINTAPTITAPSPGKPATSRHAAPKPRSRKPLFVAVALAVIALAVGAGYLALRGGSPALPASDSSAVPSGPRPAAGAAQPAPIPAGLQARADTSRAVTTSADTPRVTARPPKTPSRRRAEPRPQPAVTRQAEPAPAPAGSGYLRVLTQPPTAQIFVDGRKIGDGTVFDVEIAAGRRRLRITAPGYVTFDTMITVEAGVIVKLATRTLRPEGGP
jgi:serine/threonine protein kinase